MTCFLYDFSSLVSGGSRYRRFVLASRGLIDYRRRREWERTERAIVKRTDEKPVWEKTAPSMNGRAVRIRCWKTRPESPTSRVRGKRNFIGPNGFLGKNSSLKSGFAPRTLVDHRSTHYSETAVRYRGHRIFFNYTCFRKGLEFFSFWSFHLNPTRTQHHIRNGVNTCISFVRRTSVCSCAEITGVFDVRKCVWNGFYRALLTCAGKRTRRSRRVTLSSCTFRVFSIDLTYRKRNSDKKCYSKKNSCP